MTDRAAAIAYLLPPSGSIWKWIDSGRAVASAAGTTIAFRQELHAVAERMAPNGLPPFASILLLLAATRDGWNDISPSLLDHAKEVASPGGGDPVSATGVTLRAVGHQLAGATADLIANLNRVAELPREFRHPLEAKVVLAEMIFEDVKPAISPEVANDVVAELASAIDPSEIALLKPRAPAVRELVDVIESFKKGLSKVDSDRLQLRLRTGLDAVPAAPKEDFGPAKLVRNLLTDLADDPELGGLSRLARDLLAAVHVPRSLHRHEHLPTGGVSDLSNRGQLDRLLISELAHDDLTLAVRVAVNEALYLRRESPPREPPHRRVMLIDTGIRTWGVPRVYAAAVALALAATGDAEGELTSFRPQNASLVAVDLTTRQGLLAHLESLDARPHFGPAMPAFLAETSSEAERCESFLITHEDVLDDPDFRAALKDCGGFAGFAATVARDGTFRLWAMTTAGKSLLRHAVLNLDELLKEPKKLSARVTPKLIEESAHLPVILSTRPFPLLLAINAAPRAIVSNGIGEKAAITQDRQLVMWEGHKYAARLLSDRMPIGRLQLFNFIDDVTLVAVFHLQERRHRPLCVLSVVDVNLGPHPPRELSGIDDTVLGVVLREETIFVICRKRCFAYGLHSAEPLATLDTAEYHWGRGRLFTRKNVLSVLSLNGGALVLEVVPKPASYSRVFEIRGIEGPLWLMRDGAVSAGPRSPQEIRSGLGRVAALVGVSNDGRVIVAKTSDGSIHTLDFAANSKWTPAHGPVTSIYNGTARHSWPGRSLRNRFFGLTMDAKRNIVLVDHGGLGRTIALDASDLHLEPGQRGPLFNDRVLRFRHVTAAKTVGYRLWEVSWQDNSKAFLDSRGMLHLKSANRNIPEITLILNNSGALAGWTSDGRVYGPAYFHGLNTSHDARHLDDLIHQFTERLR